MTFHTGVGMTGRRWVLAAVLVIAVGCSSPTEVEPIGGDEPETTEPTAEPTEEPDDDGDEPEPDPPVEDDDWAVPDEIDEDYVESVLNEIYARHSAVARRALEQEIEAGGSLELADREVIGSLYGQPVALQRLTELEDLARSEEARATQHQLDVYGERRFDVASVEAASPECLVAVGWLDLTETAIEPYPEDFMGGVVLARDEELDPDLNPTGWRVHDESLLLSGGEPVPLDEIIGSDLSAVLEVECGEEA